MPVGVDEDDVGTGVLEAGQTAHAVETTHADAVATRKGQPTSHCVGECGIRLEHDLWRAGAGVLNPSRERQPGAADVGDAQWAGRGQGVDAHGQVLHVLEVEPGGVVEVDRRLGLTVDDDRDERSVVLELGLAHEGRLRVRFSVPPATYDARMPARRRTDPVTGRAALAAWRADPDGSDRTTLATAVRFTLDELGAHAPGRSVEVRVPPFGAVQCVEGPRHTRGTPPNVVEADPETWLRLATGMQPWAEALAEGRLRVSGTRAHLDGLLPLPDPEPDPDPVAAVP